MADTLNTKTDGVNNSLGVAALMPTITLAHLESMKRAVCALETESVDQLNGLDILDNVTALASGSHVLVSVALLKSWRGTVGYEAGYGDNGVLMDLAGEIRGVLSPATHTTPEKP